MSRNQRILIIALSVVAGILFLCCAIGAIAGAFQKDKPSLPSSPTATSGTSTAPSSAPSTSAGTTPSVATSKPAPTTSAPPPPPPPSPPAQTDQRYATCAEVKAHGLGPYYRGRDVEYTWYRDNDNDGIVCE